MDKLYLYIRKKTAFPYLDFIIQIINRYLHYWVIDLYSTVYYNGGIRKGAAVMAEQRSSKGKENKLAYIREYSKEKYDRINLTVAKGMREHYKDIAESRGMTISSLFTTAVDEYIENHG